MKIIEQEFSNIQSSTESKPKTIIKQKQVQLERPMFLQKIANILQLVLPPFIWLLLTKIWIFISSFIKVSKNFMFKNIKIKQDKNAIKFNKRRYETDVQHLKLDPNNLGFTNQVLYQQSKQCITFYAPTYVTCKIKSIQDISIQSLLGYVSCAMILNIYYGDIPEEIVHKLQTSIILQLNRGQALRLQQDGLSIICKNDKKNKFLIFTLRKIFLGSLKVETLWTPFQIVELIITITLNTVTIPAKQLTKAKENSLYNENKEYKVSFNCMRNNDKIAMSYAMDCVFGIYDLAQKKLEAYSSKESSYSQIIHNFQNHKKKIQNKSKTNKQTKKQSNDQKKNEKSQQIKQLQASGLQDLNISGVLDCLMNKTKPVKKQQPKKVKYYQYNHFIIPLYTYPGNALASIFIPLFLLALVSLAIFFQEPQLSGRIDTIATMVLGYIALIPSIKGQSSSQLTIVQTVVYMQTMCCLLCLYESFKIYYEQSLSEVQYKFIWNENLTYMICLCAHISTFLFISCVYITHKLIWQPSYNNDQKISEQNPRDNRDNWINPYCDQTFTQYNEKIKNGFYPSQKKQQLYIKPYKIIKTQQKKIGLKQESSLTLSNLLESCGNNQLQVTNNQFPPHLSMISENYSSKQSAYVSKLQQKKKKISHDIEDDSFYEPNQEQYYKIQKNK